MISISNFSKRAISKLPDGKQNLSLCLLLIFIFSNTKFKVICKNAYFEYRCHIPQSPIVLASAGHLGLSLTVPLTLSSMFQCPRAIRFRSERPMGLCDYFLIFISASPSDVLF